MLKNFLGRWESRGKFARAILVVALCGVGLAVGFVASTLANVAVHKENLPATTHFAQYMVSEVTNGSCVGLYDTICIECSNGHPPSGVTGVILDDNGCLFQVQPLHLTCQPCPGGDGEFVAH